MQMAADRVLGIVMVAIAALYAWRATVIQESFIQDPVGPKAFPFGIAVIMAIAGAALVVRPGEGPVWPAGERLLEIAAAVLVMVLYTYALPVIGFVPATTIASAYLTWRLGAPPLRAVAAGLATAIGIFVIFKLILGLSLATGPLGV